MPNATHQLARTDRESEIRTLYLFTARGAGVTVEQLSGSTEDERHHSEGWGGHSRTVRTMSTEAARKLWKELAGQGFQR